jgi:hypothetical protein
VWFSQLSNSSVAGIGSVQSVVAMLRPVEGARIYARDASNRLWIIRQTGTSKTLQPNTIVWSEWHPLGNDCRILATGCTIPPANAPYTPPVDLFSLDSGYEVNVLSEDPTTGALTDLVMLKPDGTKSDAEYVTRYITEITMVDENSAPQPYMQVTVTADEAIGIWVGSNLYTVSSQIPAHLTTDGSGRITFAFFAADLHTPTFHFQADGLSNPSPVYPAREVNDYLAGSLTAMPNRQRFSTDALLQAQMQTGPSWNTQPTKFVSSENRGNAPKAAEAISAIYSISVSSSGESGQWSVAPGQPSSMNLSSFWHDLCKFPHDIIHGIEKAALKVRDIAVNFADKVVEFTMELANGVSQILHLAINTFKDIVAAVKSVFRYIERGVEQVIDWLKALFNWNDILNSKRVVAASLDGLLGVFSEHLDPKSPKYAGTMLDKYFGDEGPG